MQREGQLSQQEGCASVSRDKAWRHPGDANHFLPAPRQLPKYPTQPTAPDVTGLCSKCPSMPTQHFHADQDYQESGVNGRRRLADQFLSVFGSGMGRLSQVAVGGSPCWKVRRSLGQRPPCTSGHTEGLCKQRSKQTKSARRQG